ncbi:MAG TPA: hypothetical protein VH105_11285 [Burkholderiales bacterium]|nr:hypothetical protein [Burkholderiales bacterium]
MGEAAQETAETAQAAAPAPQPATLFGLLENFAWTLLGCVAFVWSGVSAYGAFLAGLVALCAFPWLIYSAIRAAIRPRERKWRLARIMLWAIAIAIVLVARQYHEHAARQRADAVLAQVQDYHARKGTWPRKPEDMGLTAASLKQDYIVIYGAADGDPYLMYHATSGGIYAKYVYDFGRGAWRYLSD